MHSAQTDRLHNSSATATMPTIWDRLKAQGVSHTYYFSDIPFLALYGSKYVDISRPFAQFEADCARRHTPRGVVPGPEVHRRGLGHVR